MGSYTRGVTIVPEGLRTAWREVDALRRQSTLLHRGLRARAVGGEAGPGEEDVVFLLHGFLATAGVFGPLEEKLREAGFDRVASFSYHPFRSVPSLADELRRACAQMPPWARIHLVGHSLGGVVSRHYVQELGGHAQVVQTISLASPFHGTQRAVRVPEAVGRVSPLVRDMAPGSALLARLRAGAHGGPPHTSFVAMGDTLVTPPESAVFPAGEVVRVPGVGHNALLFDEATARGVSERIARVAASRRAAAE